jgi:hypothetical protein
MGDPKLTLAKSQATALLLAPGNPQRPWTRFPGAASMMAQHNQRVHDKLYTEMPERKLLTNDGNFTSPYDVVKGLGFEPNDETLWAHRVARMVTHANSEMHLRKSAIAELREDKQLPSDLRAELGRRIVSFYRQKHGGKPLAKAFVTKQQIQAHASKTGKPKPKQGSSKGKTGKLPMMGGPKLDDTRLEEEPPDPKLLKQKIHVLHNKLVAAQQNLGHSAALIHLHNEIKSEMRDALADPKPEAVAALSHKVMQLTKLAEGPPEAPPDYEGLDPDDDSDDDTEKSAGFTRD